MRKGGKLLLYASQAEAVNALEVERPAPKPAEVVAKTPEPPKAAKPIEVVQVAQVKQIAKAFDQTELVRRMIAAKQYEALIALYEQLIEQDEEEVELLLLS